MSVKVLPDVVPYGSKLAVAESNERPCIKGEFDHGGVHCNRDSVSTQPRPAEGLKAVESGRGYQRGSHVEK